MIKKRILSAALSLCLMISLTACGGSQSNSDNQSSEPSSSVGTEASTRVFTDSLGREVTIPSQIDKVALSGPMAQIVLFALCPDKLVGLSDAWSADAAQYLDQKYYELPQIGQLYGGRSTLNPESLLSSGAQIVIDVGEPKGSVAEDLDALQEQTGIPVVHVTATTETTGDAYRMLGDLLNMQKDAEALATYCENAYDKTLELANSVDKVNLLYITGDSGQNVIAKGSYHAEIIDLLSNNLAEVENPSAKGTGNEVSLEQILLWNPDYIIFSPDSIYSTVATDPAWQEVPAIANGNYYEVPNGPYNWMGFPPSVQRYLGMQWMAKILYPEETTDMDFYKVTKEYYDMFYHCDLTQAQYDGLVANSISK